MKQKYFLDRQTVKEIMEENRRKILNKKRNLEKKLSIEDFEETYNPLKVYARLRDLEINKEKARELASWYEDVFYKIVIDEYKRIKK